MDAPRPLAAGSGRPARTPWPPSPRATSSAASTGTPRPPHPSPRPPTPADPRARPSTVTGCGGDVTSSDGVRWGRHSPEELEGVRVDVR
jgi:hypothetical protein